MILKFKRTIVKYNMLSSGDIVLVGVSGGPDSMALLHLLIDISGEYMIKIKVAHLNHGFRKEAAEEAEFVRKAAESLKLPAIIRSIDVPSIKENEGLSAQEAAREARYVFFEEAARDAGANKVALAHTANDQTETVLMRFIRGAGPLGLSGIPPVREINRRELGVWSSEETECGFQWPNASHRTPHLFIIRPLIDCSRKDVERYLSEKGISYVIDSSNLKMDYMRNRVRMELIPFLERYNPNIKETLARNAEVSYRDNQFLEMEAVGLLNKLGVRSRGSEGEPVTFNVKEIKKLHPAISSRIIRGIVAEVKGDMRKVSFRHILDILNLIDSGEGRWTLHLPDITVSREHENVVFKKGKGRR